jgi:hypothetical protein
MNIREDEKIVNDSLGDYLKKERDSRRASVGSKNKLNPFLCMKYYDQVRTYHRVIFNSEKEATEAGYRRAPR